MPTPKRLSEQQQREVRLSYLCGVNGEYLEAKYGVGHETQSNITFGWNTYRETGRAADELANFYKERVKPGGRGHFSNAAHMLLGVNGVPVDSVHLLGEAEHGAYENVEADIFDPLLRRLKTETGLDVLLEPASGFEKLALEIFGRHEGEGLAAEIFMLELQLQYSSGSQVKKKQVYESARSQILQKIKSGALCDTSLKQWMACKALQSLKEREREVIELNYGLFDPRLTLEDIGKQQNVTRERIRQLKTKAFGKLGHGSRMRLLKPLVSVMTDEEAEEYYADLMSDKGNYQSSPPEDGEPDRLHMPIEELELSVRTYNALKDAGIRNVGEILQYSENQLLGCAENATTPIRELQFSPNSVHEFVFAKPHGFSPMCVGEIKEAVGSMGLKLKNEGDHSGEEE
ncbi:MAG: hypothetical protein HY513_02305 [Candidatus Aenigmarchaeota archaeon]|nr:hypothetical protein [Candidatus Aenigmarchaeota archaeon]